MKKNTGNNPASRICVSIAEKNQAAAIAAARCIAELADVIEIRLDYMADPSVAPFLEALSKPLLFTNRPHWAGGNFQGDEETRIALLEEACRRGAAYVDLELRADAKAHEKVLDAARKSRTRVIVSWHDFSGTPNEEELADIFEKQHRSGGQIGKIVTLARTFQDVLRVLNLQLLAAQRGFPLIAFCMGEQGMISRVATVSLGGYMTYAAPDSGVATAPGQLPVGRLRTLLAGLNNAI